MFCQRLGTLIIVIQDTILSMLPFCDHKIHERLHLLNSFQRIKQLPVLISPYWKAPAMIKVVFVLIEWTEWILLINLQPFSLKNSSSILIWLCFGVIFHFYQQKIKASQNTLNIYKSLQNLNNPIYIYVHFIQTF